MSHAPRTIQPGKVAWAGNLDGFQCKHVFANNPKATKEELYTPFITTMDNSGFSHVESDYDNEPADIHFGGCGNKVLYMVMDLDIRLARSQNLWGYIQMRILQRWDTCAAEAILRANGGDLFNFFNFVTTEDKQQCHYLYKKDYDGTNTDFDELKKYLEYNENNRVIFGENHSIATKEGQLYAMDDTKINFAIISDLVKMEKG
eukprot:gene15427-18260_t